MFLICFLSQQIWQHWWESAHNGHGDLYFQEISSRFFIIKVSQVAKTTFSLVDAKCSHGLAIFGRFVSVWVSDWNFRWIRIPKKSLIWSSICVFIHKQGVRVMHERQQGIIYGKNKATSKAEIVLINPINDFQDIIIRLPILAIIKEECPHQSILEFSSNFFFTNFTAKQSLIWFCASCTSKQCKNCEHCPISAL